MLLLSNQQPKSQKRQVSDQNLLSIIKVAVKQFSIDQMIVVALELQAVCCDGRNKVNSISLMSLQS